MTAAISLRHQVEPDDRFATELGRPHVVVHVSVNLPGQDETTGPLMRRLIRANLATLTSLEPAAIWLTRARTSAR